MKTSSKAKNNIATGEVKVENEVSATKVAKTAKKTKVVKVTESTKTTKPAKKEKVKKTSKVVSKKKKDVEEPTFEEKAFANGKKKVVTAPKTSVNYIPIVVGLVCVALVIGIVAFIKTGNISLVETKIVQVPETTVAVVKEPESTAKVVETTKAVVAASSIDTSNIEKILPYYDKDVYSEAAMYAYDKKDIETLKNDIEKLQVNDEYNKNASIGKKDVLEVNKQMIINYLDTYDDKNVSMYNQAEQKSYLPNIINAANEKKGKYYYSDFVAISLFANAIDKNYYYEVPTLFYKKVTIKKSAFDKMEIGDKGSVSLPLGDDVKMVPTEVTKESADTISYVDKDKNIKKIILETKNEAEYTLTYADTNGYVLAQYLQDNVAILKNARVGHGRNIEYIANNYMKYPKELDFEIYVPAKDIVNKTSTNEMLNGQWINSNKQIWDEKGFLISLVNFEN